MQIDKKRLVIICMSLFSGLSLASESFSNEATSIETARADSDFAFSGEYIGTILHHNCCQNVGIQVAALGDGKYTGMMYQNGLPGNGWNGKDRSVLNGNVNAGVATLKSDTVSFQLKGVNAKAYANDQLIGCLRKVTRTSTSMHACPPACATVLFDGTHTRNFKNGRISEDGYLEVGTELIPTYRDFLLHLEFRTPYMPAARSQNRGNSGVYINSRYEVQILDSFGLEGKFNECGALYRFKPADQNMAFPPLVWQTYDIRFRSPRFDENENKIANARITVAHNNVIVQNDVELPNKTGAGKKEGTTRLPIKLQDHGSSVHFRNIWIVDFENRR